MKVIVLASVPHTGTFFVEDFFRHHDGVAHCLGIGPVLKSRSLVRRRLGAKAWEEGLEPGYVSCMQAHLTAANFTTIMVFSLFNPLVIPMRDPLLALVSTAERNPDNDPMKQVDAFVSLAERIEGMHETYVPMYVPVDLMAEQRPVKRYDALVQLQLHCGLPIERSLTTDTASLWAPINSAGKYPLKTAYYEGEKKPIWDRLGREIGVLQANQETVRPMLERIGYSDLLWWD